MGLYNYNPKAGLMLLALLVLAFLGMFYLFTDPTLTGLITYSNEAEYVINFSEEFNTTSFYNLDFTSLTNNNLYTFTYLSSFGNP
jgi:hypothetical protein